MLVWVSFLLAGCSSPAASRSLRPTTTPQVKSAVPQLEGTPIASVSGRERIVPGRWRNITPTSIDLSRHSCTDLKFDPSNPTTLYAFYGTGGGVWRSTNAGVSWLPIGDLPKPNSLGRILVDPRDPLHLYATGSVDLGSWGFWVSRDGGQTWTMPQAFQAGAETTWNLDVYNIAADPSDFEHVLLTFHRGWPGLGDNSGVLETKDGGASFIVHRPPVGMDHGQGIAFLFDPPTSQGNSRTWLVGAGYGSGIFRTQDAGKTWQKVAPLQQNHGGFDAHYSSQGFVYIGARDGIFRSTDNGATWHPTGVGGAGSGSWYYGVIGDGKRLYTSPAYVSQVYDAPFVVTPEGGPNEGLAAWTTYNEQTFSQGPWKMVFDAKNRVIYSAHWGGGAWALTVKP